MGFFELIKPRMIHNIIFELVCVPNKYIQCMYAVVCTNYIFANYPRNHELLSLFQHSYTKLYNQMYVYTTALVKIDGAAKGLKQYIF